jgi:hypothetical protein
MIIKWWVEEFIIYFLFIVLKLLINMLIFVFKEMSWSLVKRFVLRLQIVAGLQLTQLKFGKNYSIFLKNDCFVYDTFIFDNTIGNLKN